MCEQELRAKIERARIELKLAPKGTFRYRDLKKHYDKLCLKLHNLERNK